MSLLNPRKKAEAEARLQTLLKELIPLFMKVFTQQYEIEEELARVESLADNFDEIVRTRQYEYSEEKGRKFEYTFASTTQGESVPAILNAHGAQGWELVSTQYLMDGSPFINFFFKREIIKLPDNELAKLDEERKSAPSRLPELQRQLRTLQQYRDEILARANQLDPAAGDFLITNFSRTENSF
jgi:hypothetical protein